MTGAATFAFNSRVSGELVQHFGDWASDAYKVYLEFSLPARLQVPEKMCSLHRLLSSCLSHATIIFCFFGVPCWGAEVIFLILYAVFLLVLFSF